MLTNALWRITAKLINETARRKANVQPIPPAFQEYKDMDNFQNKKQKPRKLTSVELNSLGEGLYALLMKPVKSSKNWVGMLEDIKHLADCLISYSTYLDQQSANTNENHYKLNPVGAIAMDASIVHRSNTPFGVTEKKYVKLDVAVEKAGLREPIIFDEEVHLSAPFKTNIQRFRYFKELQLSMPVDVIRFCPGGSLMTTFCIIQVPGTRCDSEILVDGA